MALTAVQEVFAAGGTVLEYGVLTAGAFAYFRHSGCTLAEAAAYALVTAMMALSFLFQASLMLSLPPLGWVGEALLVAAALATVYHLRGEIVGALAGGRSLFRNFPLAGTLIVCGWGCLALEAVWLPPGEAFWRDLAQVLQFQAAGSLWVDGSLFSSGALPPLNALILPYAVLRMGTDLGSGFFGFAAYLAIGFGTYALARRYAWPATALTVSFVVVSLPRLVYQAAAPGGEMVPAAAALFCVLAAYRCVEAPHARDLALLLLGAFFSIGGSPLALAFPSIFAPLAAVLLFRRHGRASWWALVKRRPWWLPATLPPALLFSQGWLWVHNAQRAGDWIATAPGAFAFNADGIQGSAANLVRYLLESIDLLAPTARGLHWMLGIDPLAVLQGLHTLLVVPFFGSRGAAADFSLQWSGGPTAAGFGPFGLLLILTAVAYAAWRGPRRLKATAVALGAYVFLVTLIPAWLPGNARYFSVFFVCGGFCTAFTLPPWRFTLGKQRLLQVLCAVVLFYALWGTVFAPAGGRWYGRTPPRQRVFGDDRVARVTALLPAGTTVGWLAADSARIYPFLRANPDVGFIPLSLGENGGKLLLDGRHPDYLLCVDCQPPGLPPTVSGASLWQAAATARWPGGLLQMAP